MEWVRQDIDALSQEGDEYMLIRKSMAVITLLILLCGCAAQQDRTQATMDSVAESYVKLALRVGLYDPDYIDAYYGPEEWKPSEGAEAQMKGLPYEQFRGEVKELISQLGSIDQSGFDALEKLRLAHLEKQLLSVEAKIDLLSGKKMTFDEESLALYDAVAPKHEREYFEKIVNELDQALPGKGDISERFGRFRNEFVIPKEKLSEAFDAALAECRKRTMKFIKLPDDDRVEVEYVTGQPWGAYNWYKGNSRSIIQVNSDFPISVDQMLLLVAHEGYPGHHLYGSLMDMKLFRGKNWVEFSVDPLSSPRSLIAEGLANYGIEMAFPGSERFEFERDVLFPLAGLDKSRAERYHQILEIVNKLDYAMIEGARRYIDGIDDRKAASDWLIQYCLMPRERVESMFSSIELYRSYLINYVVGEDIIRNYMQQHAGTEDDPEKRWPVFTELLSTPRTASDLE